MTNILMKKFLMGEVAIHCNTVDEGGDLLKSLAWFMPDLKPAKATMERAFKTFNSGTCFQLTPDKQALYANFIDFYKLHNVQIIDFQELIDESPNCFNLPLNNKKFTVYKLNCCYYEGSNYCYVFRTEGEAVKTMLELFYEGVDNGGQNAKLDLLNNICSWYDEADDIESNELYITTQEI